MEGVATGIAEVDTTGQPLAGRDIRWYSLPARGQWYCSEAGCVHHPLRPELTGRWPSNLQPMLSVTGRRTLYRRLADQMATVVLQLSQQRQHHSMTVYNARFR